MKILSILHEKLGDLIDYLNWVNVKPSKFGLVNRLSYNYIIN